MKPRRQNVFHLPGVRAVEVSWNKKLGLMSSTYISQGSCPASCVFLGNGCYAETGPMGWSITNKLNIQALRKLNPEELANNEAIVIGQLTGRLPLRLHVVGDCSTQRAAQTVSEAARLYSRRYNQIAFGYTHSRNIPREAWGDVSILASCESPSQVREAWRRGYAAAIVVPKFEGTKAYSIGQGVRVLPCPEMTGLVDSCSDCGLCMNATRLLKAKLAIGFTPHGSRKERARLALPIVKEAA